MTRRVRAVVIGAGQAGLAAAHELCSRGMTAGEDFVVIDANNGPGGAWRHRWDSLTLGRAHGIASLPGMPFDHADEQTPASRIVADYYGAYEESFELDVIRPAVVRSVSSPDGARQGDLLVEYDLDGPHELLTEVVLSATGTWRSPFVPFIRGLPHFRGRQLHTVDYIRAEDFRGRRTLVVGGGLSAVQFLLELAPVTETVWATRRPPNFTHRTFDARWGIDVEEAVRERTTQGVRTASVVRTTGIPPWEDYLDAVRSGVLVSRGMFEEVLPDGVRFGTPMSQASEGLGPSSSEELAVPESWDPLPAGSVEQADVIFWNTGFRHSLNHLGPLRLRSDRGGIEMADEVRVAADPRVFLVGYGSAASTVGATRAGRKAGRLAARQLELRPAAASSPQA